MLCLPYYVSLEAIEYRLNICSSTRELRQMSEQFKKEIKLDIDIDRGNSNVSKFLQ